MLYLAYGSNMNVSQMNYRCPEARIVAPCDLLDYRLVERTYADIEPQEGATVFGLLWDITEDCEEALDFYEGVANGFYYKHYIECEGEEVLVYIMRPDAAGMRNYTPFSDSYRKACREGAEENGITVDTLYQREPVSA